MPFLKNLITRDGFWLHQNNEGLCFYWCIPKGVQKVVHCKKATFGWPERNHLLGDRL